MLEFLDLFSTGSKYKVKLLDVSGEILFNDGLADDEHLEEFLAPNGLLTEKLSYDEHPLKIHNCHLDFKERVITLLVEKE